MLGIEWSPEHRALGRRPLLEVTCVSVGFAEAAIAVGAADAVKVEVRRWRRLPDRVRREVRALEEYLAPTPAGKPPAGAVRQALRAVERRLAEHGFGWLLGALERGDEGAAPFTVVVLVAAPREDERVVVPVDL
jgi:hypothetical protein